MIVHCSYIAADVKYWNICKEGTLYIILSTEEYVHGNLPGIVELLFFFLDAAVDFLFYLAEFQLASQDFVFLLL